MNCCKQSNGATVYAKDLNGQFNYRTHDHVSVVFGLKGSVWQSVLPYCVLNACFTALIVYFQREKNIDFSFSAQGHQFMSILVSFLVVTRCNIAYQRYCQFNEHLITLMRSARELVQHAVVFTRNDASQKAQDWRFGIARQIITLLRSIVYVLTEDTDRARMYNNLTLMNSERAALEISVGMANERTPNVLVIFLRTTVASHIQKLQKPLDVNEELALITYISEFITAYHQLTKLIISPFPFPLVQMTRTLLFIWVFTLPLGLDNDLHTLVAPVVIIFFMTFGFLGLEFLSIYMDDPFGKDPIDFDVLSMSRVVFDDIYINIHDVDGRSAKESLQKVTGAMLSHEIKKGARGHARNFSKVGAWNKLKQFKDPIKKGGKDINDDPTFIVTNFIRSNEEGLHHLDSDVSIKSESYQKNLSYQV